MGIGSQKAAPSALGVGWRNGVTPSRTQRFAASVSASDSFDGGNVQLEAIAQEELSQNEHMVKLKIKPDVCTELEEKSHFQCFAFRSTVSDLATDETAKVTHSIESAADASCAVAWEGSTTCFTSTIEDTDSWQWKTNTRCQEGRLCSRDDSMPCVGDSSNPRGVEVTNSWGAAVVTRSHSLNAAESFELASP